MNARFLRACRFLLPLAALVPSGCIQGPDYQRPDVSTGTHFREGATSGVSLPDEWWRLYRSPGLNRLVASAQSANQDLAAAKARLDTARALTGAARSGWWPQATASLSITKARASEGNLQLPPAIAPDLTTTPLRAGMDLTYEPDLWGRVRRSVESAQASETAAADRWCALRLSIAAEVARTFFLHASLSRQADILTETVRWRRDALEMQTSREKAGLITGADVTKAKTELELAAADVESLKRQRGSAEHALAALCGLPPSQFHMPADSGYRIPSIDTGLPSSLLSRRPDIRGAEQAVVSANASIGVAKAEQFPSFRLLGSGGLQSLDAGSILNWENRVLSFGPSVTAPVLTGGRIKANIKAAEARRDEAVAAWRQSVITALREVEDALLDLKGLAAQDERLAAAESAAAETDKLARDRYAGQVASYFEVVDANRTLLSIRLTRAQIHGQRAAATAALARALGGGFSAR